MVHCLSLSWEYKSYHRLRFRRDPEIMKSVPKSSCALPHSQLRVSCLFPNIVTVSFSCRGKTISTDLSGISSQSGAEKNLIPITVYAYEI